MEPSAADILSHNLDKSVTEICIWVGLDDENISLYLEMLGFEVSPPAPPQLLSMLSADMHQSILKDWKDAGAKPVLLMKAAMIYKIACSVSGVKDGLPPPHVPAASSQEMAIPGSSAAPTIPGSSSAPANGGMFTTADGWFRSPPPPAPFTLLPSAPRTIKASALIDPTDESVIYAASTDQVTQWYLNYKNLKFGDPLIEREPTPDQICAMSTRVIDLGAEPYADFSLLTPYGRRMQKVLRHRSWIPQQDGSYQPVEVPGPADWDTWKACWDVYEVILLMLRRPVVDGQDVGSLIATPISLEAYLQNFQTLVKENPGCWHLCATAEDRCRAEHFPRIARRLSDEKGYPPSWSDVFVSAANDDKYWDQHVRRPALRFLATRGSAASHSELGGTSQPKRGRQERETRLLPDKKAKTSPKGGGKGAGKGRGKGRGKGYGEHPKMGGDAGPKKDKKGLFLTTREGEQICFAFASGKACQGSCGRVHVCQHCLQPHCNSNCTKKV